MTHPNDEFISNLLSDWTHEYILIFISRNIIEIYMPMFESINTIIG